MNKTFFKAMVCCTLCTTISCSNHSETIIYSTDSLKNLTTKVVKPEKIPLDIQLTSPMQIERVNDSLLIVFDADADKKCKLLNLKGTMVGEFAQLGHSKDELISPVGISLEDGSIVNVYDYSKGELISYSIHDVMAGINNPHRITNVRRLLENNKIVGTAINFVQSLGSNRHLLFGNNQNRIMLLDGNIIKSTYSNYPNTDSDEECNWAIWGHSVQYKLSPDTKHLILTTYIGTLFEIFNLNEGIVQTTILKGFIPPKYNVVNGAIPKWISPDGESPEGFYALCASNNRFYASIGGVDCGQRDEIYSFDYEGNPEGKYLFPGDVKCFTQMNDSFFFIIENNSGEYGLYQAQLPALK